MGKNAWVLVLMAGCAGPVNVPADAPRGDAPLSDAPQTWARVTRPVCDAVTPVCDTREWSMPACGDETTFYPESVSVPRCMYAPGGVVLTCSGPGSPGCYAVVLR